MRVLMNRLAALVAVASMMLALAPASTLSPVTVSAAGNGWQQVLASNPALARAGSSSAYDSARGVTVVFGGWNGQALLNDTWEYDGNSWVKRSLPNSPSPRAGASMAYSPAEGRLILFGGFTSSGGGGFVSDTWQYDGTNWIQRAPVTVPSARAFAAAAADPSRSVVELFGGLQKWCDADGDGDDSSCAAAYLADTWEWDGNNWVHRAPTASPSARGLVAMSYDSARARTVLFGGLDASGLRQDTWEYNGTTWSQVSGSGPSARGANGIVYDSARAKTVLFGGCQKTSTADGGTWEWDGSSWVSQASYGSPGSRAGATFVFDSHRSRTVLMGGLQTSTCEPLGNPTGDTWELALPVAGAATGLSVTADETSIPAGASSVRLADIPASRLNQMVEAPSVAPYGTTPVGGTQFGGIQFGGIQFGGIQFGGIQFGGIQFGGIQFGGILDGPNRVPAGGFTLADIQLSSVPGVDWNTILQGSALQGQVLQTLTLQQVYADPVAGPRFKGLTVAQSQLNQTLLRSLPVGDFLVGTGPLDNIPVPAGSADWCAYLRAQNWKPALTSCADSTRGGTAGANVDPGVNSLVGLDVAGAPTAGIGIGGIQFGGIGNLAQTQVETLNLAPMNIGATQFMWDHRNCFDIKGDIFTRYAVTAGERLDQFSITVDQVNRESIHFYFTEPGVPNTSFFDAVKPGF